MQLNSDFYKRRLQDRLAVDAVDERGNAPVPSSMSPTMSLDELLAIPDDTEFVRQAYLHFLKREADLDGLEFFSTAVRSSGRAAVVDELRASAEGLAAAGAAAPVAAPSIDLAAERAEDRRILALGRSLELTGLLTIAGDEAFVSALYEEVLGRPVDPDGLAHHLAALTQGATRDSLTQGLAASPESRQAGRPMTWHGQPWPPAPRVSPVRRVLRRWLIGENLPVTASRTSHREQIADRLFHRLAEQREALAGLERVVVALQRSVATLRSEAPANALALIQRQDAMAQTVATLANDVAQGLQRIRASQAAQRTGAEEVLAAAKRAAEKRTALVAGDNVVVSEVNGFIVGVPGEEWRLAAFHAFRGVLEPGLTRRFTASLASGMTVVDVGANVGMYTLIAARGVAPHGKVYSFEPTPRTFAILKDNIQVNGLLETGLVDLRQMAVTDRRGTARLSVYRDNNGHNTLFAGEPGPEFVDVDTVALDDALDGVARVDLIKIDAEGAEPLIWNGMARTLQQNPAIKIFMEFAPSLIVRAGQDPGAFFDRLVADGFRIQRVHDDSGALLNETRESLCSVFSANVMLTRAVA